MGMGERLASAAVAVGLLVGVCAVAAGSLGTATVAPPTLVWIAG